MKLNLGKIKKIKKQFEKDYEYNFDIFTDDIEIQQIKYTINEVLNEKEKLLMILYIEFGTINKVSKLINLDYRTTKKIITQSIEKIKDRFENVKEFYWTWYY